RVPLADVIALSGPIADADREALAAGHVNAILRDPHGFLMSDTLTLSDEPDWREIGVRRLIDLLRRTATQRGATYVFEPNGDVLRRVIERSFGHMLDDLLRRGAFAGKDAAHSYRLMIDASDADRMNGRLTVEIAVAPARPMRFLTVVLRQIGERLAVVEER
uniref:phage tail sheath C-terminal domain-containing protein n=1 Tax=Sphingomonas sp. dw_22 TaxID=2721175 RepID=UPI001BD3B7D6